MLRGTQAFKRVRPSLCPLLCTALAPSTQAQCKHAVVPACSNAATAPVRQLGSVCARLGRPSSWGWLRRMRTSHVLALCIGSDGLTVTAWMTGRACFDCSCLCVISPHPPPHAAASLTSSMGRRTPSAAPATRRRVAAEFPQRLLASPLRSLRWQLAGHPAWQWGSLKWEGARLPVVQKHALDDFEARLRLPRR